MKEYSVLCAINPYYVTIAADDAAEAIKLAKSDGHPAVSAQEINKPKPNMHETKDHPHSKYGGPCGPACPNCNNSMQNARPAYSTYLLRCATCKTVFYVPENLRGKEFNGQPVTLP